MPSEKKGTWKFLFLGIVIGIIGWWILGFTVFGWVTSGTAQDRVDEAVLSLAAEICAYNFQADPNFETNLAALKKTSSWQRDSYIEDKGKWAIMPGEKSARYGVADACVRKLSDLLE